MRRIGVVTTSRADYGIYRPLLRGILAEPALELQLVVAGMHLCPRFGLTVREIEAEGLPIACRVPTLIDDDMLDFELDGCAELASWMKTMFGEPA